MRRLVVTGCRSAGFSFDAPIEPGPLDHPGDDDAA
jgi:hypothetical protein